MLMTGSYGNNLMGVIPVIRSKSSANGWKRLRKTLYAPNGYETDFISYSSNTSDETYRKYKVSSLICTGRKVYYVLF